MNLRTALLTFSLVFLFACENKKISDLETQIADLQRELRVATDPETVNRLQREIAEAQRAKVDEMVNTQRQLEAEVQKTTDKASCENLAGQIQQLQKDIDTAILEFQIPFGPLARLPNFECTEQGFVEETGSNPFTPNNE